MRPAKCRALERVGQSFPLDRTYSSSAVVGVDYVCMIDIRFAGLPFFGTAWDSLGFGSRVPSFFKRQCSVSNGPPYRSS